MSGARPDTWMPLYWGDYHRDTGHLSAAEHGAYLMLLGHYWTTGKPLPADDGQLSRIARMTPQEWKRSRTTIAAFFTAKDGGWTHGRVEHELERAIKHTERRSKAGKKGAETRWQPDSIATGNRIAAAPPSQWQTDGPSPSPSQEPVYDGSLSSNTDQVLNQNLSNSRITQRHHGSVNYSDPKNRNAYADKAVADVLASKTNSGAAWLTVFAARDPTDPDHERAKRECEQIARTIPVVWNASDERAA